MTTVVRRSSTFLLSTGWFLSQPAATSWKSDGTDVRYKHQNIAFPSFIYPWFIHPFFTHRPMSCHVMPIESPHLILLGLPPTWFFLDVPPSM